MPKEHRQKRQAEKTTKAVNEAHAVPQTSESLNKAEGVQMNRFADLLARAEKSKAEVAAYGEQRATKATKIIKPSNWSSKSDREKSHWLYRNRGGHVGD